MAVLVVLKLNGLMSISSFRQIAVADLTIINKTDLVNEEELAQIRAAVRSDLHAFTALMFPHITELASFS